MSPDTATLRTKIAASTGAPNIKVSSANGQVVLSGEASDAVARYCARSTAATGVASATKIRTVIDAMKVAPSQQVMLKVRFLEVDRTAQRDLGVNWFGGNKNGIGVSGLGATANSTAAGATTATTTVNGASTTASLQAQTIGTTQNVSNGQVTLVPLSAGFFLAARRRPSRSERCSHK